MRLLLILLLLAGCSQILVREEPLTLAITEDGYVVIMTSSRDDLYQLCGIPPNDQVMGCAWWASDLTLPKDYKPCAIIVLRGDIETPEVEVLEHEQRHCREGTFHP